MSHLACGIGLQQFLQFSHFIDKETESQQIQIISITLSKENEWKEEGRKEAGKETHLLGIRLNLFMLAKSMFQFFNQCYCTH